MLVNAVEAGSPAARGGLRRGDVILGVNREPVAGIEDFAQAVTGNRALLLQVLRGRSSLFLMLQ